LLLLSGLKRVETTMGGELFEGKALDKQDAFSKESCSDRSGGDVRQRCWQTAGLASRN
jgi:hypothetical protein